MGKITEKMRAVARKALENKEVDKILGWERGDLWWESYPVFISEAPETDALVWNSFCVNNLSKFLMEELKNNSKVGVFVKGCDSTSFNQLLKDNRIDRERVVLYGIPCEGMIDPEKIREEGIHRGVKEVRRSGDKVIFTTREGEREIPAERVEYDKCLTCTHPNPVVSDLLLGDEVVREEREGERFRGVEEIEGMTSDERYDFWADNFKRCIRCNACRNICPACSCTSCTFDNNTDLSGKAKAETEDAFFHITRAYHVAGRCVDCGECARVCPQGIPLDRLNRKIIKDINEIYGDFDAGLDSTTPAPLVTYKLDDKETFSRGGGR